MYSPPLEEAEVEDEGGREDGREDGREGLAMDRRAW